MMIVEEILNNAPKPLLHIADVVGSAEKNYNINIKSYKNDTIRKRNTRP